MVVMALAGVVVAVVGVAFLAVGAVKLFSFLMPNWLAWAIVGIILILVGIILALARR
jgi:type VI protein secretion system component VasK